MKIGDRVQVNYPVDDFQNHVGIVEKIFEHDDAEKIIKKGDVKVYWPFLGKSIVFSRNSLDLV